MRRYLIIFISLAVLSCSPLGKYKSLPEVKAWENDIQQFEQLDKNISYPENAILFAGSSSIRLWTTLEKDMTPYPVIQRGYGGAKLSDFIVYADRIFKPHPCKAIVIFIANDITGTNQDKSPEEVAGLFRSLLKIIRKSHPETPVFWIALTPTVSRWKVWPEIMKANSLINDICYNTKNTYFIRTDYAFLNENGQPKEELFRDDKLHLTEKGYFVWTGILKKRLNDILGM
jgi:hypothetical protein